MISVAAYCRVSTDKKDQANSFEAQQRYFRNEIERHPEWELAEIYADEGITGTSTKKRVRFNQMIADAYAGKFTLIVTKEISRFSRNVVDTINYTRQLKAIGVGVLFLTENLNSMNPESEMMLTFLSVLAQEESRRTSVRVKWGQMRQMEQGVVFGHSLLGYEVEDGRIRIEQEGAKVVRRIFESYGLQNKGTSQIARELREEGYLTSTGNPHWRNSHIVKILRNEKYVGDLVQKKTYTPDYLTHAKKYNRGQEEQVVIRDHHDPIISRELWNTVQDRLARRRIGAPEQYTKTFLFSGRIRCGECGKNFTARQLPLSDGTVLRRWACSTVVSYGKGSCEIGRLLRDDDAHEMLRTAFQSLSLDRRALTEELTRLVLDVIRAGEGGSTENPERLQRLIDAVSEKKAAALDAYFGGDITREEMTASKTRYDNQLADLHERMAAALEHPPVDPGHIRRTLSGLLSGETESEGLNRSILDHITVYHDRHTELRLKGLDQIFHFQ